MRQFFLCLVETAQVELVGAMAGGMSSTGQKLKANGAIGWRNFERSWQPSNSKYGVKAASLGRWGNRQEVFLFDLEGQVNGMLNRNGEQASAENR